MYSLLPCVPIVWELSHLYHYTLENMETDQLCDLMYTLIILNVMNLPISNSTDVNKQKRPLETN